MNWYLYVPEPKTGVLLLLSSITRESTGRLTDGDIDADPPMVFNSREEALFVNSSIASHKSTAEPISEEEIERRHTPTGLRYRRKP